MRIRNARLRAYTEKEREQARLKTERERREKQLNADIEVYLKKNYPWQRCPRRHGERTDRVEVSGDIKGMPGEVYLCEVPMFRELTEKDFLTVQLRERAEEVQGRFRSLCGGGRPALRPAVLALGAGPEIAERHADLLARPLCRRREGQVRSAP